MEFPQTTRCGIPADDALWDADDALFIHSPEVTPLFIPEGGRLTTHNTMPQSLAKVYVHLVFSTKYRQPLIDDAIKPELFDYLGGVCQALECHPVRVGGHEDHVHILCILSKKIALMDLLEEVKKRSSKWIKTKGVAYEDFYWQDGYGAFSVNPAQIDVVARYIDNQVEHHRKRDFKDEFRAFLNKYKIEYDERYVWD